MGTGEQRLVAEYGQQDEPLVARERVEGGERVLVAANAISAWSRIISRARTLARNSVVIEPGSAKSMTILLTPPTDVSLPFTVNIRIGGWRNPSVMGLPG